MFPILYLRIKAFFGRLFFTGNLYKITIYTKGGNVIKLRNLTSFKIKPGESVSWTYKNSVHSLIHIDIEQIEAIVQE